MLDIAAGEYKDHEARSWQLDVTQYRHRSLSDNEIRCVRFDSSSELHQGYLNACNRLEGGYSALSYEWGSFNPHVNHAVRLTDDSGTMGTLSITKNLEDAITDLKKCPLESGNAYFIDQLCVNQQNNAERSIQVAGMKHVYGHADRVVVYLGPAEVGDLHALDLLTRLDHYYGEWFDSQQSHILIDAYVRGLLSVCRELEPFEISPEDASTLENLFLSLYDSGWTKRLWMCQEAILNRTITFLKGPRLVSERSLFLLASFTRAERFACTSTVGSQIMMARRDRRTGRPADSLRSLVEEYATTLACSNPRDKIYALLGLARDNLGIVPDYRAEIADVFTDFARRCIDQEHDLSILNHVEHENDDDDDDLDTYSDYIALTPSWPTWVPSFKESQSHTLSHFAGGSIPPIVNFNALHRTLMVKGVRLERIECIAGVLDHGFDRWTDKGSRQSALLILDAVVAARKALTLQGTHDADSRLSQALIDDAFQGPLDGSVEHAFNCFLDVLRLFVDNTNPSWEGVNNDVFLPFDDSSDSDLAREYFSRFCAHSRAICLTKNADIVLTSESVQVGDIVTTLLGGTEVYLLRNAEATSEVEAQNTTTVQLIGLAYAHNYMNGEALTDLTWESQLLNVLLDLISEKLPTSFFSSDSLPDGFTPTFTRVKNLVGTLTLFENLRSPDDTKSTERDIPASTDLLGWSSLFSRSPRSRQSEILHRGLMEGIDNESPLYPTWRSGFWDIISDWMGKGYLSQPAWLAKAETYCII